MADLHSAPLSSQSDGLWAELMESRRELEAVRLRLKIAEGERDNYRDAYERLDDLLARQAHFLRELADRILNRAGWQAAKVHAVRLGAPGGIKAALEASGGPEAATGTPEPAEGEAD